MRILTVRAVLCLKTPTGKLCKHVNWSHYEEKAMLTTSTSSSEAFNRFLINTPRIINASKMDLQYLDSIWFYEESRKNKDDCIKENCTKKVKVGKDMKLKVII